MNNNDWMVICGCFCVLAIIGAIILGAVTNHHKQPQRLESKDESWGQVREYIDPKTSRRYLVFTTGSNGIAIIPAPLDTASPQVESSQYAPSGSVGLMDQPSGRTDVKRTSP